MITIRMATTHCPKDIAWLPTIRTRCLLLSRTLGAPNYLSSRTETHTGLTRGPVMVFILPEVYM